MNFKRSQSLYMRSVSVLLLFAFSFMSVTIRAHNGVVLNAGTNVALETIGMIQSNTVIAGQAIDLRVKYDVKVGDKVVIPAGTFAKGLVTRSQQAKGIGKEGFLEIQVRSVTAADGQEVFLTGGNVYKEGQDKQTLSIVLGVFVCLLFLAMKGENAEVPAGYQLNAAVATTTTLNL
jgi:hypothetical protein